MSTVKIENRVNELGVKSKSREEFISEYKSILENHDTFAKDVLEFSEIMAKHPADIFIVPSFQAGEKCEQIRQGDIYLFRKGEASEGTLDNVMYAKYSKTISEKRLSKSMNLQFGDAITGDHKVVPLKGTDLKIYECSIELPIKNDFGSMSRYEAKIIESDGPFAVVHGEHGNITCDKGTYLACVQLDARTLTRVTD